MLLAYGCQEDTILSGLDAESGKTITDFEVKLHNGYLWFKDSTVFEQTLQDLANLPREDRVAWEQSLGFQSLESIYDQALAEDEKMFARLEKLSQAEIEAMSEISDFSDFTLENQDLFKFTVNEEEASYSLKVFDTELAPILNQKGIVRIGNFISQYNEDSKKTIIDGDDNKIVLFNDLTKSRDDVNILFQKVDLITISMNNGRTSGNQSCNNSNGSYRVLGNITLLQLQAEYSGPGIPVLYPGGVSVELEAKTQKRSWGKWRNHTTGYNRIQGELYVYDGPLVADLSPTLVDVINHNADGSISTKSLKYKAYERFIWDIYEIPVLSIASVNGITFKGKNNTMCGTGSF